MADGLPRQSVGDRLSLAPMQRLSILRLLGCAQRDLRSAVFESAELELSEYGNSLRSDNAAKLLFLQPHHVFRRSYRTARRRRPQLHTRARARQHRSFLDEAYLSHQEREALYRTPCRCV